MGFLMLSLSSCTAVKEYEKVNINDPEMALSARKAERFETNFQLYREGSSGANGGKTGGGCGCN
ncbi:arginine decarboxylase [Mangrovimonas sp. DI 80]|nr:arginine decarboxylase [Mangrovimonas sp. DI 80]